MQAAIPVTRKLKILLVDDEEVVRDVIAFFCAQEHEVEVTPRDRALRLVREQEFDLVITDHAMPGMTGGISSRLSSAGFDIPIDADRFWRADDNFGFNSGVTSWSINR